MTTTNERSIGPEQLMDPSQSAIELIRKLRRFGPNVRKEWADPGKPWNGYDLHRREIFAVGRMLLLQPRDWENPEILVTWEQVWPAVYEVAFGRAYEDKAQ